MHYTANKYFCSRPCCCHMTFILCIVQKILKNTHILKKQRKPYPSMLFW